MSKLVIVESPAKAKTISRFLGSSYDVQASFGHIRDLPESASDIPADFKKVKWAKLGVNVDSKFEPLYVVTADKKRHVDTLKKAAKGIDELLLATDEDREGESISWHILQLLNPAKKVKVRRIVFHEITPEAIEEALRSPRDIDDDLVRAQETRRILDRLYGYTLSPLLWKKVAPKLSAGRVQSVATRLCVERERARQRFVSATYWDLDAELGVGSEKFKARLQKIDGQRVATGKSFDPETGKLIDDTRWLSDEDAGRLGGLVRQSPSWTVVALESKPGTETPPKPFTTSTLQQEAARKLRYNSKRTMQIAQALYEGIDLGGERVGLITYMRTDSLNLAERALTEARDVIRDLYGDDYLPPKPVRYKTKSKGAQEAHEAIRPTTLSRRPQDVKRYLTAEQFALYDLIWKRTIACQMVAARVTRTQVEVEALAGKEALIFGASGKEIVFSGFLRAYVEGVDDPEAELEGNEKILPSMKVGQNLNLIELEVLDHATMPPARYTEASLIKKLEEEGIGRPSTYVSIISTIQDRGYIYKRGNELIPTFTAFAVTQLLEGAFHDLVDTTFTAKMESELDEIAEGKRDHVEYLQRFYHGNPKQPGIQEQVEKEGPELPFPAVEVGNDPETGDSIVVRIGRYGAFLQRGEGGDGNRSSLPDDLPPAELTVAKALELISKGGNSGEAIAVEPESGLNVVLKKGRFGDYLELEQSEEEKANKEKPRRWSLPPGMKAKDVQPEDIPLLTSFPRSISGANGEADVTIAIGPYGPYVKQGSEIRNVADWREAATLSYEEAKKLLAAPKPTRGGRTGGSIAPREALREFGKLEGAQGAVRVLDGRYGPYVTDGTTNATLPKTMKPEDISAEQALELLIEKAKAGPVTKRRFSRSRNAKRK